MTPSQARDVLLTTSSLQAPDGPDTPVGTLTGGRTYDNLQPVHDAPPGTPQVPGVVSGWGLPNLQKPCKGRGSSSVRWQWLYPAVPAISGLTRFPMKPFAPVA